jgi:hypothetical protein
MKKLISIIAIMLCTFIVTTKAVTVTNKSKNDNPTCACCKNCKDEKCMALCKKWAGMTPEARKSAEGQKVKDECMGLCKEKKCCSADGKTTCEGMMDGKDCCKKK